MLSSRHVNIMLALLTSCVFMACTKQAPSVPATGTMPETVTVPGTSDAVALVEQAIGAAGGLDKVRLLDSFSVTSTGTVRGFPFDLTSHWRAPDGLSQWDRLNIPATTWVKNDCWQRFGDVTVSCTPEMTDHGRHHYFAINATHLYPLLNKEFASLAAGKGKLRGRNCDTIVATSPSRAAPVTLYFDPKTHLLAGFEQTLPIGNTPTTLRVVMLAFGQFNGLKAPTRQEVEIDDRLWMSETVTGYTLSRPDDAWFQRAAPLRAGATRVKSLNADAALTRATTTTLNSLPAALQEATQSAYALGLAPAGPAAVFASSFPKAPDTSVELRVVLPVLLPENKPTVSPPFSIGATRPCTVVARIATGPADAAAHAVPALQSWAVDKGITVKPFAGLILYNPSAGPDDQVWEVLLPVSTGEIDRDDCCTATLK